MASIPIRKLSLCPQRQFDVTRERLFIFLCSALTVVLLVWRAAFLNGAHVAGIIEVLCSTLPLIVLLLY